MAKVKKQEVYEEEDEGQFEEDELEDNPEPLERRPRKKVVKEKVPEVEPKKRFGIVPPQPVRLIDVETNELLGEGDSLIATALADVLERLERIENSIGSMLEG